MHVGNAKTLHAGGGHVGLAVQHLHLLLQGHLGDDGIDFLVIDRQAVLWGLHGGAGRQKKGDACREEKSFGHYYVN